MLNFSLKTGKDNMRSLAEDTQGLLREATAVTSAKADELRHQGLRFIGTALSKVQDAQTTAMITTKEVVTSAEEYVQDNPWKAIAVSVGAGLLAGLFIARK